ncbi:MAG: ATP-binding protein [Alphaproteobacteria bacterium]
MIKPFLPKRLFGRTLLILVLPSVIVAGISTYVFIDRHMQGITQRLASDIAGDISTIVQLSEHNSLNNQELWALAKTNFGFELEIHSTYEPYSFMQTPARMIGTSFLQSALMAQIAYPHHVTISHEEIFVDVEMPNQVLHVSMSRKRLLSSTTEIFLIILLGTPFALIIISAIFLRNQMRPIRRLAAAAEKFGKGQSMQPIKPEGAYETKQAGIAFNQMLERIRRQITQRTEMLAGVSHDLRTPLTRMELQLAMMDDGPDIQELRDDVRDMRKMVQAFLDFAKGEEHEPSTPQDVKKLLQDALSPYAQTIKLDCPSNLTLHLRPHGMKRCMRNLIENAAIYAENTWVTVDQDDTHCYICVDDDGPGIAKEHRQDVLKPFFRLDPARAPDHSGVGLGLSIAHDYVHKHGGRIILEDAPQGGLRVTLRFPK